MDNKGSIEQQLKFIYRKLNERTALSNLSNYANIAEKISKGNIEVNIDSVNKIVMFGNGNDKLWMNLKNKSLNNVNSIVFQNSQIKGMVDKKNVENLINKPSNYADYAVSGEIVGDFMNNVEDNYAAKEHKHLLEDIYKLNANEEEETLDELLDGKADVGHKHLLEDIYKLNANEEEETLNELLDGKAAIIHNHDERYSLLSNITSEIQNVVANTDNVKVPNITAIRAYCADFLTPTSLSNNSQLQELIRGKSAFEVWEEQQPIRYEQDGTTVKPYTYNDYINAISGAVGSVGPQGPRGYTGLSAYEIWCLLQEPSGYDNEGNPLYPNEAYFIASLQGADGQDGQDFIDWYISMKELTEEQAQELTWEDICNDIIQSASIDNESGGSSSIMDIIDSVVSVAEGAGLGGLEGQVATLQGQAASLQSQVFTLQGAVGAILSSTVTDDALEGFDEITDAVVNTVSETTGSVVTNAIDAISKLASKLSSIFSRLGSSISSASSTVQNSVLHASLLSI